MIGYAGYILVMAKDGQPFNPADVQEKVLGAIDPVIKDKELPGKIKDAAESAVQNIWSKVKQIEVPTQVSGLPEEVVIDDVVNNLVDEVKQLPENQVKKVKIQFCQDVISEATASANQ